MAMLINETSSRPRTGAPFEDGGIAVATDDKGKRYVVTLAAGSTLHTHRGAVPHDDIIGQPEGVRVASGNGRMFLVLRPTLAEYIVDLPRITQIIYPKDLGHILMEADPFPGARILEAGMGSGALSLTLLRAIGEKGQLISYEARQDVVNRALRSIRAVMPNTPQHVVRLKDAYEGIEETELDRIVLDLPEPWTLVSSAAEALLPGGILLCFVPTTIQVHRLGEALLDHPWFDQMKTFEVLQRTWHVDYRSVRPDHRMVAHTGFMTVARKCSPKPSRLPPEELAEDAEDAGAEDEGQELDS
jgi:tRNA (adenine57-N1/adenine58-N1)-methyltransferase